MTKVLYLTATLSSLLKNMNMASVETIGKGRLIRFTKGQCRAFIHGTKNPVNENLSFRVTLEGPISEAMDLKRKMQVK